VNTPWSDPTVGGVTRVVLDAWSWAQSADAGCDPGAPAIVNMTRGAPSYDEEVGILFGQPVGGGIGFSHMEAELRLPFLSSLHPSGGPSSFAFCFEWLNIVGGAGQRINWFWSYKVVGQDVDGAAVPWVTVSARQFACPVVRGRNVYTSALITPLPSWVFDGVLRLRLGRRAVDPAGNDTFAQDAVITGAVAYVVTN
jgi:hypothetical protein